MNDKTIDEMRIEIQNHYKKEREDLNRKWREEQRIKNQAILDKIKEREQERKKQQEINNINIQKEMEANWDSGKINNVFIRQHLEAKIVAARWMLGLGMAATLLFKGQWLLWIVLIIMHSLYVNKITADAIEADKRRKDFGKKR